MKDSDKPADSLVYHVYSTPLITAGGSYGAVINPTPDEVAVVIDKMANFGHPSFRGIYIQSLRQSELIPNDEFISNILVSRRPATAYVVTIVLEYSVSGGTWKIPYVPVILFGCRTQNVANFYRVAYGQPIFNASSFIDCGILPKDTPIVLFPIAVLLIASFLYATSCNVWIWPRCAVSMMIMGSAIGLIFFYRFSDNFSDTYVILIVSALLPAFIALFAFVVLWWYCIRPTLYYRRMFGRGPLVKVENPTSVLVNEPWDSDVLDYNRPNVGGPSGFGLPIEYTPIDTVNALPPVQEEVNVTSEFSINNAVLQHFSNNYHSANPIQPTIGDDDNQGDSCFRICGIQLFRRSRDYQKSADSLLRPFKPFKLRPRRFARLPPVLPATFIFVAFLAVSLALPIGLLSFFKNFAFGISTAFVGFYITLCCASFFLIPNSLLPHIVIEYFLMLTWFDVRLHTLRIEFYGQYDILVLVIWFVGSVCFGLLTLCLIRLQDARELTEFQHYNTLNTELPYTSTYVLNRANTVSDSYPSLSGDAKPSSKTLCYVPHIVHVSYLNANVNSATSLDYSHSPTMLHENMHTGSTADDNVVVDYQRRSFNLPTSKVLTENQPLLKSRYYTNYGCLSSSSTGSRRLLPLSRVQLGTASQPLPFGSLSSPSVLPYKMDSMQPNISGDGVNFSFTFLTMNQIHKIHIV
ncbi:unnamed protein product [Heterobilharzia americana]|nr:unnamed protein product [Heterobilharzia americana]